VRTSSLWSAATSAIIATRLVRFLKVTIEGNYFALADEKRVKEVLARELKLSHAKIIDASYPNFRAKNTSQRGD
jgi:hypothetical protein